MAVLEDPVALGALLLAARDCMAEVDECPPELCPHPSQRITPLDRYALVTNDADASRRIVDAFRGHFSATRVHETGPTSASEDFGSFGAQWHVPSVFWFVGGTDPDLYAKAKAAGKVNEIPSNHNPRFAPVIHPALRTGVEALVVAARAWLSTSEGAA